MILVPSKESWALPLLRDIACANIGYRVLSNWLSAGIGIRGGNTLSLSIKFFKHFVGYLG